MPIINRKAHWFRHLLALKRFGFHKPKLIWDLAPVLKAYNTAKGGHVRFVQIGSNDGFSGDPLFPCIKDFGWQGVLVEPVESNFKKLVLNYDFAKDRLHFAHSAIGEKDGTAPFYIVDAPTGVLPDWVAQLSSFQKEVIVKHASYFPDIEKYIREIPVRVESFDSLIKRHGLENVDLIHTDTEGYDFEILKTINLESIKPDIILFEQKHLSAGDVKKSLILLRKAGFVVYLCWGDCIAVRTALNLNF